MYVTEASRSAQDGGPTVPTTLPASSGVIAEASSPGVIDLRFRFGPIGWFLVVFLPFALPIALIAARQVRWGGEPLEIPWTGAIIVTVLVVAFAVVANIMEPMGVKFGAGQVTLLRGYRGWFPSHRIPESDVIAVNLRECVNYLQQVVLQTRTSGEVEVSRVTTVMEARWIAQEVRRAISEAEGQIANLSGQSSTVNTIRAPSVIMPAAPAPERWRARLSDEELGAFDRHLKYSAAVLVVLWQAITIPLADLGGSILLGHALPGAFRFADSTGESSADYWKMAAAVVVPFAAFAGFLLCKLIAIWSLKWYLIPRFMATLRISRSEANALTWKLEQHRIGLAVVTLPGLIGLATGVGACMVSYYIASAESEILGVDTGTAAKMLVDWGLPSAWFSRVTSPITLNALQLYLVGLSVIGVHYVPLGPALGELKQLIRHPRKSHIS